MLLSPHFVPANHAFSYINCFLASYQIVVIKRAVVSVIDLKPLWTLRLPTTNAPFSSSTSSQTSQKSPHLHNLYYHSCGIAGWKPRIIFVHFHPSPVSRYCRFFPQNGAYPPLPCHFPTSPQSSLSALRLSN